MCAGSCNPETAVFIPVDQDVPKIVVNAEAKQIVTGMGDGPTVFVVVVYDQTVSFCAVPEFAVMVGAASGAILDTLNVIVIMYHFVE